MSKIKIGKVYVCDDCGKVFKKKFNLQIHVQNLHGKAQCKFCDMNFSTTKDLRQHLSDIHGDKSVASLKRFQCNVCDSSFVNSSKLKYHRRKHHYNLQAKLPYCDRKKVNQVWFEKVLNSNVIVEIKKTEQNMLLMRKLDEKTSIKVNDMTEVIDLQRLYPIGSRVVANNLKKGKS